MILDSNVDPRGVWYQDNLDQDVAFNRNINIWFAWVAKYDSVYHLGSTEQAVARAWYSTEAQLAQHPAGGVVGADEWNDAFQLPTTTSSSTCRGHRCSPIGSTTTMPPRPTR
jgi:hypothetical protein